MMDDLVVLPNFFRPGAADLQLTSLNLKKKPQKKSPKCVKKKSEQQFL